MGAFIVKQPNGLYCRFSTVVDCPTDWNMTEEDYIELCAERAREEARFTLNHCLKPFEWVERYFVPMNMTQEEFENCLREMGEPIVEAVMEGLPAWASYATCRNDVAGRSCPPGCSIDNLISWESRNKN